MVKIFFDGMIDFNISLSIIDYVSLLVGWLEEYCSQVLDLKDIKKVVVLMVLQVFLSVMGVSFDEEFLKFFDFEQFYKVLMKIVFMVNDMFQFFMVVVR